MDLPDVETYRMQMAAIGVGALANTWKSVADQRIPRENPYWTVALQDVYTAVDREIAQRERAEKAEKVLETINMLACYASEEDTDSRVAVLLQIGKLARGEVSAEIPTADGEVDAG